MTAAARRVAFGLWVAIAVGFNVGKTVQFSENWDDQPPTNLQRPKTIEEMLCFGYRVNVNEVTEQQLALLSGVGPSLARQIILYRQRHGRFGAISDLRRVRGVGPKRYQLLHRYLTVEVDSAP